MQKKRKLIRELFMKEYVKGNYSNLNVTFFCKTGPISRATFYAYYNSVEDIKNDIEDDLIQRIFENDSYNSKEGISKFVGFLEVFKQNINTHWNLYNTFLNEHPDLRFIDSLQNLISYNFTRAFPKEATSPSFPVTSVIVASYTLALFRLWIKKPNSTCFENLIKAINVTIVHLLSQKSIFDTTIMESLST